jgi:hypothetical protein
MWSYEYLGKYGQVFAIATICVEEYDDIVSVDDQKAS